MRFIVKSGKHSKTVEAIDFNQAAQIFLKSLFVKDDEQPRLGAIISVSCEITEQFVCTNEALQEMDAEKKMGIYKGEQGEQGSD